MAVYNYITYVQARQELANRLYDSNQVFWSAAELGLYLCEALQVWNALTSYWRGDFLFTPIAAGGTWWDLSLQPNSLRPYTVTDQSLYSLVQYHLLEPVAWNPWTGASSQFTADDLVNATERRMNELISSTGCTITRSTTPATLGRITLADSVIDIRRLAYLPAIGSPNVLWTDDAWAMQSFQPDYLQNPAGTPDTYVQSTQPPISFDVSRPPAFGGSYELLTVNAGPSFNVSAASTIPVPTDWCWAIKYGALADLLSRDSLARDPLRAHYSELRYRMAIAAMQTAPSLMQLRINNVPIQIDSVHAADEFSTSWQGLAAGPPTKQALLAGLNLLALVPAPDSGTYSATATVVQNAPLPIADSDPVQVARDDFDVILDYAQHIATFKSGGAEFSATLPLLARFFKQAQVYNGKLHELGEFVDSLLGLATLQDSSLPLMTPAAMQVAGSSDSSAQEGGG